MKTSRRGGGTIYHEFVIECDDTYNPSSTFAGIGFSIMGAQWSGWLCDNEGI